MGRNADKFNALVWEIEMRRAELIYPQHRFKPEELLTFVELHCFTKLWKDFGLTDEDLMAVQIAIMCNPKGSPVIPNTGGLRKLRFAQLGSSHGKSSGFRVCYAFFEIYKLVLLALVYPKNQKDNLSAAERTAIRNMLRQIEEELDR